MARVTTNGASAKGLRQVGYFDCPGGGQVVVDGQRRLRRAHEGAPRHDDRRRQRSVLAAALATLEVPAGTHSHKVRAANGLMLVNREAHGAGPSGPGGPGGLGIYDVSDPSRPRELTLWRCGGLGVHRFTFDGRYAYISPEMDGYVGNIVMILDLADPARPRRGGALVDAGAVDGAAARRRAGRGGSTAAIIRSGSAIGSTSATGTAASSSSTSADLAKPRFVSGLDWSPPFLTPTHTALAGAVSRSTAAASCIVADEDVAKLEPGPPSFLWLVDITDERRPMPFASFQVDGHRREPAAGVHRLPSAVRARHRHRDSGGLVRPRPAHRRHRQAPCAARSRAFPSAVPEGHDARVQQRRVRGRSRAHLPDRPGSRAAHSRAGVSAAAVGHRRAAPARSRSGRPGSGPSPRR